MNSLTLSDFSGGTTDNYLSCAQNCYALADNLSIDVNGKLYTRWGTFAYDTKVPSVSNSNTRVSGIYLGNEPFGSPFAFQGSKVYFAQSSSWTEVLGPASNSACPNKGATDVEKALIWRRQLIYTAGNSANTVLPHRIWCSATNTYQAVTLGLPAKDMTGITFSFVAGANNYQYQMHFDYQFTDYQGTLFEERGGTWGTPALPVVTLTSSAAPNVSTVTINGIPSLANTASTNYDVATLKVFIYRTINNGKSFYLCGQVTNGTTTFADTMSDVTLITQVELYTDGGVLPYAPPPVGAKYVAQVNDFFWYATESTITHSVVGAPGGCPTNYYQPIAQKIQGLSDILSFPVLFCDRSVYRIDGVFDELGGGGFTLYEISQTAGCVSNKSIVKIPGGLVWAGNGGFYFTDGYQVQKISYGLDLRYPTWKSQFMAGVYDSVRNQVVWTVSSAANSNSFPCDGFVVLHLRYGLGATAVFTTWSSQGNIFPTSLVFSESFDVSTTFRSKIICGEARGFMLYQDSLAYTDPYIDVLKYPTAFAKKPIIYRFESSGLDLGSDARRKYCVDLTAEMMNETDIAIQYLSRRDDGGAWGTFSEIRSDIPPSVSSPGGSGALIWDISDYGWDATSDTLTHDWNSQSLVEGRRYFPSGTLRSTRRQIGFTNSFTFIAISDNVGLASITTGLQVSLASGHWPYDCEDYWIGIDPLATGVYTYYRIRSRVSDTVISVYDPSVTFPTSLPVTNIKWQMTGYRKNERVSLLSFTVNFDEGNNTQNPSHGTTGLVNG